MDYLGIFWYAGNFSRSVSMCNFTLHFPQKLLSAWEYKSKCEFPLEAMSEIFFFSGTANIFEVIHAYNRECGNG